MTDDDVRYMKMALKEAEAASAEGEIPVGAVIVCEGKVIAKAHNQTERLHDTTAHAEMIAFTSATEYLGAKYLPEATLYVTLEPCVMCAGAAGWTQVGRIVYGAADPKRGFSGLGRSMLHPRTEVEEGVLAEECAKLVRSFFAARRQGCK